MRRGNDNSIIILGGNFIGLYSALRCAELGYDVCIIDKSYVYGNIKTPNYTIFHKHHTAYINLLQKFNIKYSPISININTRLRSIINKIIAKSKFIPRKSLVFQPFTLFCKNVLQPFEYDFLLSSIDNFDAIFSKINTLDCINIFITDINPTLEYFKLDDDIATLTHRIICYLKDQRVRFINANISDFRFIENRFILYSLNGIYSSDIMIMTLSKKNLLQLKLWNREQRSILNSVGLHHININNLYFLTNKHTRNGKIVKSVLENIHLTFPESPLSQHNAVYFWNMGINNIFMREKIKHIYNPFFFLCSESYAKNSIFINHTLELFECIFSKIMRLCS